MRYIFTFFLLLACSALAAKAQSQVVDAVVIESSALESPPVTPLEVAHSLDAVRKEIAAAKETYGEESAQVRLLTEILHNLEGTFRQQLADRGMIRTAGHQESAEHEEHEADDEEEEEDDEAEDEGEEHAARGGRRRGHNDAAIARLTNQVRELRDEVEKLKRQRSAEGQSASEGTRAREFMNMMRQSMRQSDTDVAGLRTARERIAQLERENAALRQRASGGAAAGPRAERVLNALRDQTLQHQAEATKRIEQSFEQMERRLQELEQRESTERPREQGRYEERRIEERRIEERRREDRRPRTSSPQPL